MNATNQIMNILTACGCKPAATVDSKGNATIKINAPAVTINTLFDSELAEYEYIQETRNK